MSEDKLLKIGICCLATDPLKPGSVTGYFCSVCKVELQVSPFGVDAIKSGFQPLCHSCGNKLSEQVAHLPTTFIAGPNFTQSLIEHVLKSVNSGNN